MFLCRNYSLTTDVTNLIRINPSKDSRSHDVVLKENDLDVTFKKKKKTIEVEEIHGKCYIKLNDVSEIKITI